MSFKTIKFPTDFTYSSDGNALPLEFYLSTVPRSKEIYLKLGYFSSKAIQVLSYSFAQFIYKGGVIKIITNHYLYNEDTDLLNVGENTVVLEAHYLNDLQWIQNSLSDYSQHFINCLKYLVLNKRLEIVPVIMRPGKMAHYKEGVFVDEDDNQIFMDGSCNFTASGLVENAESMKVCRSWGGDYEKNILDGKLEDIIKILDKKNDKYDYLDRDAIINAVIEHGEDQGIEELLTDEAELLDSDDYAKRIDVLLSKQVEEYKNTLTEILEKPRFPFSSQPREYQIKAYEAWVEADRQGLFAMATGTGKTITSLNCLLNEYQRTGNYQAIILVPSKVLLNQWVDEVNLFNFRNIMPASSDYKWREKLRELSVRSMFDADMDFIIIATYLTFTSADFQKFTNNLPPELVLIADEAHNLGANNFRKLLDNIRYQKRIGLSATPKRNYDEEGNLAIEGFFNSREPYTYSFTMDRAIKEGFLCRYKYYPHIIRLTEDEMEKYAELTVRLVQFFNNDKLKKNDAVERILLERKRIIHKAENKIPSFISILKKYQRDHGGLKYTFVYAPEGNDESGDSILGHYMREFRSIFPSLIAYPYTSNFEQKELVLENFEQGITDVLFAMKCLDEGVDVPRAELAIFCSSTGNPRQFIQRRGRVLRKHPDKDIAIIHDLVVVPERRVESDSSKMERNILKSEFSRVIYFASLSNNYYEAMEVCQEVADEYDVNIYALEDELRS